MRDAVDVEASPPESGGGLMGTHVVDEATGAPPPGFEGGLREAQMLRLARVQWGPAAVGRLGAQRVLLQV